MVDFQKLLKQRREKEKVMAKKAKSKLASKVKSAVRKHRDDDTQYGIVDLPGGIKNGIAKLSEAKFDTYKKGTYEGEYYFMATGIVVSPSEVTIHDGTKMKIKGLRTTLGPIAVCDTTTQSGKKTSLDEHVSEIMNEMRKLGADTKEIDAEDLEEMAQDLKESGPYFNFSTTDRYDQKDLDNNRQPKEGAVPTGAWHNWNGNQGLEDYDPEEDEDEEVEDETVEEEVEEEVDESEDEETEDEEEGEEEDDEEYEEEGEEEEDEEDYEEEEPEVEELYFYKPPRTKKKIECEVTEVNSDKQTVVLKALETEKVYKNVSWDKLDYEEE